MDAKALHRANAPVPMDVTPLGIIIEVKLLQPLNANPSIDVILSGMVTAVNFLQFSNLQLIMCQLVLIKTVEK